MQQLQYTQVNRDRTLLLVSGTGLLLFLAAYWSTLATLFQQWSGAESAGYNHGFLVLLCAAYLLYVKLPLLRALPLRPQPWALVPLLLGVLGWLLAGFLGIQSVQMLALPGIILCLVAVALGLDHLRVAFIPVLILYFAIPAWQSALPWLQDVTTSVTHLNLRLLGRPVYVVGNYVHVSGGSFIVEEACSGLRFLLVATTLTLVNSNLNEHSPRQYLGMLALVVSLAFLANWIRVVVVILVGDYTRMQHSLVEDHANFGWVVFLVVVLLPFFLLNRFMSPGQPGDAGRALQDASRHPAGYPAGWWQILLTCALVLVSGPLLLAAGARVGSDADRHPVLPLEVAGMQQTALPLGQAPQWQPAYRNASELVLQRYQGPVAIDLHLVFYRQQRQGSELINSDNLLVDGEVWRVQPGSEGMQEWDVAGRQRSAREAIITNGQGSTKYVWFWYEVGGLPTVSGLEAKLLQLPALLSGRADATLVAIASDCAGDCLANAELHRQFAAQLVVVVE